MNNIKQLVKNRNLKFLHPTNVELADDKGIAVILKSVGYFRNFSIFKAMYTLLYKNKILSIDHYKTIFDTMKEYARTHPKDYFIKGFSDAIAKSNDLPKSTKQLYAVMIYNQIRNDGLFDQFLKKSHIKLQKSVKDYYVNSKPINIAVIRKSKVTKITEKNIIKSVIWNRY